MPSHHHRHQSDSQPEPNNFEVLDAEFVDSVAGSGFEDLDFTELERAMVLSCHPKANDYVLKLVEALRVSTVYKTIRKVAKEKSNGDDELAVVTMFALAVIAGASTMLTAVDEGYVDGDEEDEDEGDGNETY